MTEIEKYLKFGDDNGFDYDSWVDSNESFQYQKHQHGITIASDIDIITSKEFIEAVARGIFKNPKLLAKKAGLNLELQEHSEWEYKDFEIGLIHSITYDQAVAIREKKLPEYIKNILG